MRILHPTVIKPFRPFLNDAGKITNIALGEFKCVGIIETKAGKYRSKHYHRRDSHLLYVLSGSMLYWERELDGAYPAKGTLVRAGESVFTGPLVVHQTYFPEATVLISASKLPRDHESHEADVVRVEEEWCAP